MAFKTGSVTTYFIDTTEATPEDYVLVELEDGSKIYLILSKEWPEIFSSKDLVIDPERTSSSVIAELAADYELNMTVEPKSQKRDFREWRRSRMPNWERKLRMTIRNESDPNRNNTPVVGKQLVVLIGHDRTGAWCHNLKSPVAAISYH